MEVKSRGITKELARHQRRKRGNHRKTLHRYQLLLWKNKQHAETSVPLWPMLSSSETMKPRLYRAPIIHTSNEFEAFESEVDDDDDDEEAIMQSLNALTSNVNLASDKSRSQKAKRQRPKPMDMAYLTVIAQKVKSGDISLPDIDLETDEEYDCAWALVDSGAGANVARRSHFPNFRPVQAPRISLTVANGEVMENNGAGEVTSYSRDGTE